MTRLFRSLAWLWLAACGPALADSLASSASSASSASIGSISDSIHGSSNSSNRDDRQVRDGEYRIVDVAEAPGRPDWRRLTLQPLHGDAPAFWLDLPARALARPGLSAGDAVAARQRDYGIEFARADTREPFFLALADDWRRELDARAVGR